MIPYHLCCPDDVIKWNHFSCYWPFVRGIHWSPVVSPHKGQWCEAFMFSLICAWMNIWANNRNAGDLRCIWCSLWHHHNDHSKWPTRSGWIQWHFQCGKSSDRNHDMMYRDSFSQNATFSICIKIKNIIFSMHELMWIMWNILLIYDVFSVCRWVYTYCQSL